MMRFLLDKRDDHEEVVGVHAEQGLRGLVSLVHWQGIYRKPLEALKQHHNGGFVCVLSIFKNYFI